MRDKMKEEYDSQEPYGYIKRHVWLLSQLLHIKKELIIEQVHNKKDFAQMFAKYTLNQGPWLGTFFASDSEQVENVFGLGNYQFVFKISVLHNLIFKVGLSNKRSFF